IEVDRNHTPIISPATRAGASLVKALKPTGLRHSSPMVCSKYTNQSQSELTCTPDCARRDAATITTNPSPTKMSPQENFAGLDGSLGPSRTQSQANTGASAIMKIELTDWNQLAG